MLALDETIHQTSYTDTLEQNGVAKRKLRHIVKTVCSLLLSAFVPSEFLEEAVLTVTSLIKAIPFSHSSSFSSFEKLYRYVPDYPPLEFLVVLVLFFVLMQNAVSCPLDLLFVSFWVKVKVKRSIVVLIQ